MPLKQWIESANNAIEGILHAAKTQRHLRYHFYTAATVLLAGYILGITRQEFMLIALAVMAVLVAELINTAVEVMVDMLSPEHSERARQAKDIAAGAVLVTAFVSAIIGYIVFFPHIRDLFTYGFRIIPRASEEVSVIASIMVLIMVILMKAYRGKGHPLSGGMPSGHAALAFSVWVSVTFATGNAIASVLCFVLAGLIAQSRISTGIHSRIEAIVGAVLGSVVTLALFWMFS